MKIWKKNKPLLSPPGLYLQILTVASEDPVTIRLSCVVKLNIGLE